MKIGIIFGTSSFESDVSVVSASAIIKNLNRDNYKIIPIYIDKYNNWYLVKDNINEIFEFGALPKKLKKINNIISFISKLDLVFPVIHGNYGEDGIINGILEMFDIPYIGCGILANAICYDKFYTKYLLKNAGVNVAEDITLKMDGNKYYYFNDNYIYEEIDINKIDFIINEKLGYPVFIKPCKCGSSIGVTKVCGFDTLNTAIKEAFKYDNRIIIEKEIIGRELECAILKGKALEIGEVKANGDFYTFESKYQDNKSYTIIPAELDETTKNEIKKISEKAFALVDGKDLARIDFFLENATNRIILNEINTMPGWTEISMYPKLAQACDISYEELLNILINK